MGNENFLYVALGDHELTARIESGLRPATGQTVRFTFDEDSLYLFDPETGDALKTKTAEVSATVGNYASAESESA
jgi:multiple sugar transport system ATP-binding protein